MKKALLIMVMALAPALVAAQEAKQQTPPPADLTVKAFEVKPGNISRIRSALNMIVGSDNVRADENLLIVKTSPRLMPGVEEIVKRLDVTAPPSKNIEFTIYVLEVARDPLPESVIPPDLQPTVNQLRSALAYQGFRVADKTIMQARPSDWMSFTGSLTAPSVTPGTYRMRFRPKLLTDEKPPVIQLEELLFTASPDGQLQTAIDIREGQKVVVGKAAAGQRMLVLVLSAKILN